MNPTEVKLKVMLGGEEHTAYFNMNTYCAWEDQMNRPFVSMLSKFLVAYERAKAEMAASGIEKPTDEQLGPMVSKLIDLREFTALIWASLHHYDKNDEPVWTLTLGKVRRMLTFDNIGEVLPKILSASNKGMPDEEDMPKSTPKEKLEDSPTEGSKPLKSENDGGAAFGPSDELILESLTPSSEDLPSGDTTGSSENTGTDKQQLNSAITG